MWEEFFSHFEKNTSGDVTILASNHRTNNAITRIYCRDTQSIQKQTSSALGEQTLQKSVQRRMRPFAICDSLTKHDKSNIIMLTQNYTINNATTGIYCRDTQSIQKQTSSALDEQTLQKSVQRRVRPFAICNSLTEHR